MGAVEDWLIRAKEKIKVRETWCQGAFARNMAGEAVAPDSAYAYAWCAKGATAATRLIKEHCGPIELWADALLDEIAETVYGGKSIASVNDQLGFDAVHGVYDRAIAKAKERGI